MGSKLRIEPKLIIIEGKEKGRVIPLSAGLTVIGRSKGDIVVQDARISRSHVQLEYDPNRATVVVTDLKSLNGTEVNGKAIDSILLKDGDKIKVGDTVLDCHIESAKPEKPKEEPKKASPVRPTSEKKQAPLPSVSQTVKSPGAPKSPRKPQISLFSKLKASWQQLTPNRKRIFVATFATLLVAILLLPEVDSEKEINEAITEIRKLEKEQKWEDAVKQTKQLVKNHPTHSTPLMELGDLALAMQHFEEAIDIYTKVKKLKPEQLIVPLRLIRAYLRLKKQDEAVAEMNWVEKNIADKKYNAEFFIETALVFLEFKELKQPPEKTLVLAKALQREYAPTSSIGYKLEAQVHFQEGRIADALSTIEKGKVIEPSDEWLIENAVFAKLALKDNAGAERTLEEWLRIKPTATKALLVFGYLRFKEKNYSKALPYVQRILQIGQLAPQDPYYGEALHLMGQIFMEMEQFDEGINFFKQSCANNYNLGCEQVASLQSEKSQPAPASAPNSSPGNAQGNPPAATDPGVNEKPAGAQ